MSSDNNGLDPYEKKKNLLLISKKLDDEAKHQEIMFNIQKKNKGGIINMQDVVNRERIDEMYLESIKTKLAIFDTYHQSPQ